MKVAREDLVRRLPVWEALSDLFLDSQLSQRDLRYIARTIVESGYSSAEIQNILWNEVFPAVEFNLRHPCGIWGAFNREWLQQRILDNGERKTATEQPETASIVRESWKQVLQYLPSNLQ